MTDGQQSPGGMDKAGATTPAVVAVMTVRERYTNTLRSLQSLRAQLQHGEAIILAVDDHFPPVLLQEIEAAALAVTIRRFSGQWRQNEIRKPIVAELAADHVIFIDNDVILADNAIAELLRCARETAAGIVGAAITWGEKPFATVHFAGGRLDLVPDDAGLSLVEEHVHAGLPVTALETMEPFLPTGFAEFHLQVMSRAALQLPRVLDPKLRNVHAHLGDALACRAHGLTVYIATRAIGHYNHRTPLMACDMPRFGFTWDLAAVEESLAHFSTTWGVPDTGANFGGLRGYVTNHRDAILATRSSNGAEALPHRPLTGSDVPQSIATLLQLARERGDTAKQLDAMEEAYWLAARLTVGGFLPSGRPILNHLVGTAGILLRANAVPRLVNAALLHIAPALRTDAGGPEPARPVDIKAVVGGAVARLINQCPGCLDVWRKHLRADWRMTATQPDMEALLIFAAARIEQCLAGDDIATGISSALPEELRPPLEDMCRLYGMTGLCESLSFEIEEAAQFRPASFRIAGEAFVPLFVDVR